MLPAAFFFFSFFSPFAFYVLKVTLIALFMTLRGSGDVVCECACIHLNNCVCLRIGGMRVYLFPVGFFFTSHDDVNVTSGPSSSLSGLSCMIGISGAPGKNAMRIK